MTDKIILSQDFIQAHNLTISDQADVVRVIMGRIRTIRSEQFTSNVIADNEHQRITWIQFAGSPHMEKQRFTPYEACVLVGVFTPV